ncbi:sialate O-acetylesterase [Cellulosilyticum lentocellum]|uniref:Sialate O-acetylesterase domain-containing protein n=1 Tax=Cellulosilyticum lentocellum (strain ATCC 49066 / DSM 5427 / NCIMB 11756 / RHM5) TaxID=642492 RepID=F2JID0_CELLD|nr:sialate O-acetylesterase [Cellulosilyticum lentocellum]ADZ84296.1 protein of unknown function DUF303 acetylesterase [Cellulosilyticum lentocellum DSM 5427]
MKIAEIFGDYMVIQREKPFVIWGKGEEGATITAVIGEYRGVGSVKEGKWQVTIPPMQATFETEIEITSAGSQEEVYKIKHVAIGEVWLAGGQSNMEYFLRYDHEWENTKKRSFNPTIRMYNCKRLAYEKQEKDVLDSGYWFDERSTAWETFSAPGYHFASVLQENLQVPIGIIGCNWGGSTAATWLDTDYLKVPELKVYLEEYQEAYGLYSKEEYQEAVKRAEAVHLSPEREIEWRQMMYGLTWQQQQVWMEEHKDEPVEPIGPLYFNRPGGLYEMMLQKIIPYGIKGVIWYQGETDTGHPLVYDKLFSSMITCWRRDWQEELPFLFVQLAPFKRWLQCTGEGYAELRESQQRVADTVPQVYMSSIMDLGMADDIHPKKKKEVGERLALLARGKVYGQEILCESPRISKIKREKNKLVLECLNCGEGLKKESEDFSALQVYAKGKVVHLINIDIQKEWINIQLPEDVETPIEVRYAFGDFVEADIYNSAQLPLCPFRGVLTE